MDDELVGYGSSLSIREVSMEMLLHDLVKAHKPGC